MNFIPWNNLFWAFLAVAVLYISRPSMLRKYLGSRLSMRGRVIAVAQIWLCIESFYAFVKIVQTQDLSDSRQIGFSILAAFNAATWGYFFSRDALAYFTRRHSRSIHA